MALSFIPVVSKVQIDHLAIIADEVWHQHFVSILSAEQIDYMVERVQSVSAITDQIENQGYLYFFIHLDETDIGYIGIKRDDNKLFLSKLYIRKKYRGNGYASEAFVFLEGLCASMKLEAIWLTVNRYNDDTIKIYEKKGFTTIRTQVADIGNGFVMDDYIMEKLIK